MSDVDEGDEIDLRRVDAVVGGGIIESARHPDDTAAADIAESRRDNSLAVGDIRAYTYHGTVKSVAHGRFDFRVSRVTSGVAPMRAGIATSPEPMLT